MKKDNRLHPSLIHLTFIDEIHTNARIFSL